MELEAQNDRDLWLKHVKEESEVIELLLDLVERPMTVQLKTGFVDALVSHASDLLSGTHPAPSRLARRWHHLLTAVIADSIHDMQVQLRDKLVGHSGNIDGAFFDTYGSAVAVPDLLHHSDQIVSKCFIRILKDRDVRSLRWLEGVATPAFLASYQSNGTESAESEVRAFYQRLRDEMGSQETDEAHQIATRIAVNLGISQDGQNDESPTQSV